MVMGYWWWVLAFVVGFWWWWVSMCGGFVVGFWGFLFGLCGWWLFLILVVGSDLRWICSGGCCGFRCGDRFVVIGLLWIFWIWVLLMWVWLGFMADDGTRFQYGVDFAMGMVLGSDVVVGLLWVYWIWVLLLWI